MDPAVMSRRLSSSRLAEFTQTALATVEAYRLWWDVTHASPLRRSQAEQAHLAIVSWAFPPDHSSSAHFPKALTCAAGKLGAKCSVLCAPTPTTPSPQGVEMLNDIPPNITIHRVAGGLRQGNDPDLLPSPKLFPTLDGEFATALLMAQEGMRQLSPEPPSVILAFGPRFANFVAAWYLARWCGADLALCYLDEWTVQAPPFVSATHNDAKWERRCLDLARTVFFVTEGKRRAYQEAFPSLATKRLEVCENGWDPRPFRKARKSQRPERNGTLTIDFVGVAAPSAPIAPFFDTLVKAFEIRPELRSLVKIRLTGNQPPYAIASLDEARKRGVQVEMAPAVPQSGAIELMMKSDALLLLLNTRYEGVIPQKTYDYMRCDAPPILAYGTTSEGADIVRGSGAGVLVPEGDAAALVNALERLLSADPAAWNTQARRDWANSRSREDIAVELIRKLIPV